VVSGVSQTSHNLLCPFSFPPLVFNQAPQIVQSIVMIEVVIRQWTVRYSQTPSPASVGAPPLYQALYPSVQSAPIYGSCVIDSVLLAIGSSDIGAGGLVTLDPRHSGTRGVTKGGNFHPLNFCLSKKITGQFFSSKYKIWSRKFTVLITTSG